MFLFVLLTAVPAVAQPERIAAVADAYVDHDAQARSWTIGNGRITYTVGFNAAGTLTATHLASTDGAPWRITEQADATHVVAGRPVMLGNTANGSVFRAASADEFEGGVRLRLIFDAPERQLRTTRSYLSHPQSPALETWTTFEPLNASAVGMSDIGVWQIGVEADDLFWVNGLQTPASQGGPFTRRHQPLPRGERIDFNERNRSSEHTVPVLWLEGPSGALFAGISWSGAWAASVSKPAALAQLPPAYLLSFVMSDASEPMQNGADLPLYFRSRMGGVLGMTFLGREFTPDDRQTIAREIGLYKFLRFRALRGGSLALLTEQASVPRNDRWDAFQITSADGSDAFVFAFRRSLAPDRVVIRPHNLSPDATYEIRSGRRSAVGDGADIMDDGIEIVDTPFSRAQIITLRRIDRGRPAGSPGS